MIKTLTRNTVSLAAAILLCAASVQANAPVSLETTISAQGAELDSVAAMLAGNEGRLLVVDREKGILLEYKGKA